MNVMKTNKPEHVGSSKGQRTERRRRRRRDGDGVGGGEGGVKNVSREPKSTGQQTVREGETGADKKTKRCRGLLNAPRAQRKKVSELSPAWR